MMTLTVAINNRAIWQIHAHNDGTGTEEIGNYDVEVWEVGSGACGKPKPALRDTFRVEGFARESGALTLSSEILFMAGARALRMPPLRDTADGP